MYTYSALLVIVASLISVVTISSFYLTKMLLLLSCDGLRCVWNGRSTVPCLKFKSNSKI
ncbi:hypothetical protein HanXRQr2_Chr13g0611601 [Helianthus annuus]|uniref:Uncharacterized protein n=1 Tax=Helianthus annuus TaxID=4232 RepID=A0A9K3EKE0_HELAN|nr:hypothetical protein HanXRQr2_Chr13g0611601 [Helianthus annuus]